MATSNSSSAVPGRWILAVFALPALLQGFTHTAASQVLTGIYAKYLGLSLAALGTAVLISKIFDAVTDPLIGAWSDSLRRRGVSRKPWIAVGTIVMTVALYCLFMPPEGVSVFYFTLWYLVLYTGWTVTEIPYKAWSIELTSDYRARTRIAVILLVTSLLGALLVFVVPFVAPTLGFAPTKEFTPGTLAVFALIVVLGAPILTWPALRLVPAGNAEESRKKLRRSEMVAAIVGNRPLLYVAGVFLLYSFASGMTKGVTFLFLDVYLGLGEQIAPLLVVTVPMAILAAPAWGWICNRMERHRAWALGAFGGAIATGLMGFVSPGEAAFATLAILMTLNFFFDAAAPVAMPAMLGDVVDYGRVRFGQDHAGLYYSFYTFIQKSVTGAGMASGMILSEVLGFDATADIQSTSGVFGLKAAYCYLPAIITISVVPPLLRFPITRAQQEEISRQLAQAGQHNEKNT
jgi:GPH family glycoside/pentoside/hexuronide:cation symporter